MCCHDEGRGEEDTNFKWVNTLHNVHVMMPHLHYYCAVCSWINLWVYLSLSFSHREEHVKLYMSRSLCVYLAGFCSLHYFLSRHSMKWPNRKFAPFKTVNSFLIEFNSLLLSAFLLLFFIHQHYALSFCLECRGSEEERRKIKLHTCLLHPGNSEHTHSQILAKYMSYTMVKLVSEGEREKMLHHGVLLTPLAVPFFLITRWGRKHKNDAAAANNNNSPHFC